MDGLDRHGRNLGLKILKPGLTQPKSLFKISILASPGCNRRGRRCPQSAYWSIGLLSGALPPRFRSDSGQESEILNRLLEAFLKPPLAVARLRRP
jgi:hypothetical protein